jgi:hypothetical protein
MQANILDNRERAIVSGSCSGFRNRGFQKEKKQNTKNFREEHIQTLHNLA